MTLRDWEDLYDWVENQMRTQATSRVERRCLACGAVFFTVPSVLKKGHAKYCSNRCRGNVASTTHGQTSTRLYCIWANMKRRCRDGGNPWHGNRGIRVCTDWLKSFETFRDWALANGYDDDLELDRRKVNGDYCPDNCRWVTRFQQMHNTRPKSGTSRFKGVHWYPRDRNWRARIGGAGRTKTHLGSFNTEEEAAKAFDAAAKELYGEFAYLNFPEGE